MIMAACYALPSYLSLRAARKAFYEQNYAEALHRFHGNKLNASDDILCKKATVLHALALSKEQYEIYNAQGMKTEAIHALFEGYKVCLDKKAQANQYGITEEWNLYREHFLTVLQSECNVSETVADLICEMKPLEYTIVVDNLAEGLAFDAVTLDTLLGDTGLETDKPEEPEESGDTVQELEDLLPEEIELLEKLKEEQQQESSEEIPLYEGNIIDGEVIFYN